MSTGTIIKRLHVGGITPNITTQHIADRFKSFGKVTSVEDLAEDGLGEAACTFCYLLSSWNQARSVPSPF
jgi:hypothetical protein